MPTQDDVRRICLSLPGTIEASDSFAFRVNGRLFAWEWNERVHPKKRRVPNADVLVVRVTDEMDKFALLDLDPRMFFTEPHYDGYAAVLVRLKEIDTALLEKLIRDSWSVATAKRPPCRR